MLRRGALGLLVAAALSGCGDDAPGASATSSSVSVTVPTADTTTTTAVTTTTTAPTTTTTAAGLLTDDSRLGFDGVGPVKIFMTVAQAQAAAGKPIEVTNDQVSEGCEYAKVQSGPEGLAFMVHRDKPREPWRIVRAEVHEGRIATVSGIRIGATEAQVKSTYGGPGKSGQLTVEAHPYTGPEGHYLIYDVDGPGGRLLIFETDGTKVTSFRAGDEGAVRAIEGCA